MYQHPRCYSGGQPFNANEDLAYRGRCICAVAAWRGYPGAAVRRSCFDMRERGQAGRTRLAPSAGLLAAIGIVESGRRAPAGMFPIIWPWTINAEGRGFYQPSKAAAVGMVRALQLRGVRVIDVGCFQVDLFYHPYAFASLEEAFDPDANARAAARILSLGRLGSTGWDGAIAAYHSAVAAAWRDLPTEGSCRLALDHGASARGEPEVPRSTRCCYRRRRGS